MLLIEAFLDVDLLFEFIDDFAHETLQSTLAHEGLQSIHVVVDLEDMRPVFEKKGLGDFAQPQVPYVRLQKGLDQGGFADLPEAALLRRRRILGVLPGELAELLAGEGIVFAPEFILRDDLREGRLVPLLEEYDSPTSPLSAVYLEGARLPRKVRALIDFSVSYARERL